MSSGSNSKDGIMAAQAAATAAATVAQKKSYKSTSERVAESVHLVKQLADVGISNTHPHMKAFRQLLGQWVREEDFSYSGRVDFDAYGRRGDLVLPRAPGAVSSLRLRAL
jgi:hypothetical protein